MAQTQVSGSGIKDNVITNSHLHSAANIAGSKLANSGVTAGSYGSSSATLSLTINAQGLITAASTNSVNTTTNLSTSTSTTAVTIASSTGNNASISEASGSAAGVMSVAHHDKLDGIEASATADQTASEILTLIKTVDGAGSGLDADLLDGVSSASFARSDIEETITGKFDFTSSGSYPLKISGSDDAKIYLKGASNPYIRFAEGTTDKGFIQWNSSGYLRLQNQEDGSILDLRDSIRFSPDAGSNFYSVWHAGNDGSGSGLDADLLQGAGASVSAGNNTIVKRHASGYIFANYFNTTPNTVSSGVTQVCVETGHDGYIRHGTAAAIRTFINVEDGATAGGFPSGTRMIFQQTSAPTGWTKDTSDTNQRALRVVSGSASSGGSVDFTTAFASKGVSGSIANATQGGSIANGGNNTNNATAGGSVNNHTLSTGRMPSHRHVGGAKGIHDAANGQYGTISNVGNLEFPLVRYTNGYANYDLYYTNYQGSSQAHNHGFSGSAHSHSINSHNHSFSGSAHNHSFSGTAINLAVRYLDVIIAQKD